MPSRPTAPSEFESDSNDNPSMDSHSDISIPVAILSQDRPSQPPNDALVLGIDPGLNRTGYAVLERGARGPILREGGIIKSTPKLPLAQRVLEIGTGLREVLAQFRPKVMAIEQVFSTGQFPKTALLMAHARGAILMTGAESGAQIVHYTPRQIKRLLTGSGNASKEQVQHAIRNELGLDRILEPHDVADAFAIALCHYHTSHPHLPRAAG